MVKSFKRSARPTPLDPEQEKSKALQAAAAIELIHEGTPRVVHISDMHPSPLNQRKLPFADAATFSRYQEDESLIPEEHRESWSELVSLAENIKEYGVIHPITVKPVDNHYEIMAGERRYWALRLLGRESVQVLVRMVRNDTHQEILSFAENLGRSDLSLAEKAIGLRRMVEQDRRFWDSAYVSQKTGISRRTAQRYLNAVMDDAIYQGIISGAIQSVSDIDNHSHLRHPGAKPKLSPSTNFFRFKLPHQAASRERIAALLDRYQQDKELVEILSAIKSQIKEGNL